MSPKKKLTKKEKARLEAERNEQLRLEQEKEKLRKLEEEREKKLQERAEAERKHKQEIEENKIRRIQLTNSLEHFAQIQIEIDVMVKEMKRQREWQRYMRCNGLPNAYDPGDIRKYIHMWLLKIDKYNENERNWLLLTNERSILTQDRRIANTTVIYMKEQQPNLGDLYSQRVKEVLGILDEMDEAIFDTAVSESICKDLCKLKFDIRQILSEYIDEFSYKILSNIERDMNPDGELAARHLYESEVFKIQLWTLRDIPPPVLNSKEQERADRMRTEIEFQSLDVVLDIPPSIKCFKSAIRAIWLGYDHFSDYCPSFQIPKYKNLYKDLDISTAAKKEWKKRKALLKGALGDLTKKTDATSNPDTQDIGIIDGEKLYAEYEDELIKSIRKQKGPEGLHLDEFDVNIRSYRMVSGVYCFEYLEQPNQDTRISKNTILRILSQQNNLKRKPFHQPYKPPEPIPPGVRRLPEEIEAELKMVEANLEKLATITIKLSEDVMWLEPPIVCRWETAVETIISEELEKKNLTKQRKSMKKNMQNSKELKSIEDFDLFNIPVGIKLFGLLEDFVVPRLPNGYIVKIKKATIQRRSSLMKYSKEALESETSRSSIKDDLSPTNSPRPLFPRVILKKELNFIERSNEIPSKDAIVKPGSRKSYMFSDLLKDLDEMQDQQVPVIEKQMEMISETLSVSHGGDDDGEADTELDYAGVTFYKSSDFPWSKKEEPPKSETDSELSLESDDDDYETNNDNNVEIVGKWSTRDIHDAKFNEEKLAITFKAGRLGAFGLAVSWYSNVPFQTWELRPDLKTGNSAIYSLTGSIVNIEVSIVNEGYTLNSFQGGQSTLVQNAVGSTLTMHELKTLMIKAAINMFPDDDAFCYTEGVQEKHPIMESHLYTCMGELGLTHSFSWSRWNMLSSRRNCVLLTKEIIENRKIPFNQTLHVTPLKACIVDCTDVSSSFNSTGIEGMQFYADLHTLAKAHSQPVSLEKQEKMSPLVKENIIQILKATRPLCFS